MKRTLKKISMLWVAAALIVGPSFVFAQTTPAPEDLKNAIDQKTKELDEVTRKLLEAQATLTTTQVQGKTLKQEITRIDSNVKSANLNIKLSELTIDKLRLEITATQQEINVKEAQVALKRESVSQLLQGLREKEQEGLLLSLLSGESLAESLAESQSIGDINTGLLADVEQLRQLKGELTEKLTAASDKKQTVEQKKVTLQSQKAIAVDQLTERQRLLADTKNREENYKKLVSDLQKQQQDISDQIGDIEDALRAQYGTGGLPLKRPGVFARPMSTSPLTQGYGKTPDACRLYKKTCFHNGIDFGAPIGTPILAAENGIVLMAANNGKVQYGRYVVIKHDNSLTTLYAHMSRQAVKTGDEVKRGDVIGYVGNTGYAFGPHLHFGVYLSSTVQLKSISGAGLVPVGLTLDPRDYL